MSVAVVALVAAWAALAVLGMLAQAVRLLRRPPSSSSGPLISALPPCPRGTLNMRPHRRNCTHG